MKTMRDLLAILESAENTFRVYHGSDHSDIKQFTVDGIRNRTGTKGTLSFTTGLNVARIYGSVVYQAEVTGKFGDYRNEHDCRAVHEWQCVHVQKSGYWRAVNDSEEKRQEAFDQLWEEVIKANYRQWEATSMWADLNWDGAWCEESGARNLIVGARAQITNLGPITLPDQSHFNAQAYAQGVAAFQAGQSAWIPVTVVKADQGAWEAGWKAARAHHRGETDDIPPYSEPKIRPAPAYWIMGNKACKAGLSLDDCPPLDLEDERDWIAGFNTAARYR